MRHGKHTFKIGRNTGHREATMANLTCDLLDYGQIKTTVPKAKELRRLADKMITLGKRGTLHARRQALSKLRQKDIVHILFEEIAPKYTERNGGYTRIMRLGPRVGDGAEMCLVELVEETLPEREEEDQSMAEDETEEDVDKTKEEEDSESLGEAEAAEESEEKEPVA
ncbi:MAG: 50S ribosomal protein L17 [Verrucomicrobiota bacterium]